MASSDQITSFVVTIDELMKFLDSYQDNLFYFDINPATPPAGARYFEITTFAPEVALRVLDELHPGPNDPKFTPIARERIEAATPQVECGVNIHPQHQQGWPQVNPDLAKVGWVRFPFIRWPYPSMEAAFSYFDPVVEKYSAMGVKIIIVMTMELYGAGSEFNLASMSAEQWAAYTRNFVQVSEQLVRHYGNKIAAYEVWNEGDAAPGNPAAVHFPPEYYAPFLRDVSRVIRTYAPLAKVVMGGLVTGPDTGLQYVQKVQATLNGSLPIDAIGYHPYGKGAPNDTTVYSRLGDINNDAAIFARVYPNLPLWLTEVGALGGADNPEYWDDAALYMKNLYTYIGESLPKRIPVVIWYAWSDAMDPASSTNGIVRRDGSPKPYIYDMFFNLACK